VYRDRSAAGSANCGLNWHPPAFSDKVIGMGILITLQGPEAGRKYPLDADCTILGRQYDSTICLTGKAVSRHHAQIVRRAAAFFIQDLNSSNGTYLNGRKLDANVEISLTEKDSLQIGPYVFALRLAPTVATTEPSLVVKQQVNATIMDQSVFGQDPALKLQVVLEISQHLARTLDMEPLLDKLLEHLIRLFPQADRAMVLLCEGDALVVRGQRCRHQEDASTYPYSRTIVRKALDEGVGLLSEDARADERFRASTTLTSLDLHSLLCVPLIGQEGRRLGVIQVDRFRRGLAFRTEDLQLLTAVALQVAVVLENAALHAERLQEQRLHQELALAQEIQQGFLPLTLEGFPDAPFEIFGKVFPARRVAGDLYDFLRVPEGRLAFFVGDVSGKGMPAALFMVAVRTLCRHLATAGDPPSATLKRLNDALAADNPSGMFVTLEHGLYDPATGEVVLASGGHPPPLLCRCDGEVAELPLNTGRLLGFEDGDLHLADKHFTLEPGESLVFFTDGAIEARNPTRVMFGLDRLRNVVHGLDRSQALSVWPERIKAAVDQFTSARELQDDLTLLFLRRKVP
jgi:serine phosphatase RsbU (regulator of sigma subunit)/pSer/pThr/pTyr-binding forkhead associated (FHA) protein